MKNIYILSNENSINYKEYSKDNYKYEVLNNCIGLFNFGYKREKIELLKNDEIIWEDNIVILRNNLKMYKSKVSGDDFTIEAASDFLLKKNYEKPKEIVIAHGTGYEAMQ